MKGHKENHHHPHAAHAKGGKAESPSRGNFAKDEAPSDVYAGANSNVAKAAKQRKLGGAAKIAHMKHVGKINGDSAHQHAGRKPRKSGGRTGAENNPLSSASKGTQPTGRKFDMESDANC